METLNEALKKDKSLVSLREITKTFSVHQRTVHRWIDNGLPVFDISAPGAKRRTLRFSIHSVAQWLSDNKNID